MCEARTRERSPESSQALPRRCGCAPHGRRWERCLPIIGVLAIALPQLAKRMKQPCQCHEGEER